MSSPKEIKREILESGSVWTKHSLNQKVMKRASEFERRFYRMEEIIRRKLEKFIQ